MVAIGDKAPKFSLPDQDGDTVRLGDYRDDTLVLYFYPKANTSGCTRESVAFQENLSRFKRAGAVVVGVSRDRAELQKKFRSQHGLRFTLLTDADASVHKAYGAWGTKKMYGKTTEGVIRSTFVIKDGVIAALWRNVKVSGHVEKVLEAVKDLR
jgi:peroxiredoxin Q/BCP